MNRRRLLAAVLLAAVSQWSFSESAAAEESAIAADSASAESDAPDTEEQSSLQKMPEVLKNATPVYPAEASRMGIEGTVLLHLLVNETGGVDSVYVDNGVSPPLDSEAVAAARKLTFSPGIADGEPVAVVIEYRFQFSLVGTGFRHCGDLCGVPA